MSEEKLQSEAIIASLIDQVQKSNTPFDVKSLIGGREVKQRHHKRHHSTTSNKQQTSKINDDDGDITICEGIPVEGKMEKVSDDDDDLPMGADFQTMNNTNNNNNNNNNDNSTITNRNVDETQTSSSVINTGHNKRREFAIKEEVFPISKKLRKERSESPPLERNKRPLSQILAKVRSNNNDANTLVPRNIKLKHVDSKHSIINDEIQQQQQPVITQQQQHKSLAKDNNEKASNIIKNATIIPSKGPLPISDDEDDGNATAAAAAAASATAITATANKPFAKVALAEKKKVKSNLIKIASLSEKTISAMKSSLSLLPNCASSSSSSSPTSASISRSSLPCSIQKTAAAAAAASASADNSKNNKLIGNDDDDDDGEIPISETSVASTSLAAIKSSSSSPSSISHSIHKPRHHRRRHHHHHHHHHHHRHHQTTIDDNADHNDPPTEKDSEVKNEKRNDSKVSSKKNKKKKKRRHEKEDGKDEKEKEKGKQHLESVSSSSSDSEKKWKLIEKRSKIQRIPISSSFGDFSRLYADRLDDADRDRRHHQHISSSASSLSLQRSDMRTQRIALNKLVNEAGDTPTTTTAALISSSSSSMDRGRGHDRYYRQTKIQPRSWSNNARAFDKNNMKKRLVVSTLRQPIRKRFNIYHQQHATLRRYSRSRSRSRTKSKSRSRSRVGTRSNSKSKPKTTSRSGSRSSSSTSTSSSSSSSSTSSSTASRLSHVHGSENRSRHRSRSRSRSNITYSSSSRARHHHHHPQQQQYIRKDHRRTYSNEHKIDKKKLLEIAQRNAAQMAQSGSVVTNVSTAATTTTTSESNTNTISSNNISNITNAQSVHQLVDFCQRLQRSEGECKEENNGGICNNSDEDHELPLQQQASSAAAAPAAVAAVPAPAPPPPFLHKKKRDDENVKVEESFVKHPFVIKQTAPITINITNATSLPIKTPTQRTIEETQLRMCYPVSSGQQHREKDKEMASLMGSSNSSCYRLPPPPPPPLLLCEPTSHTTTTTTTSDSSVTASDSGIQLSSSYTASNSSSSISNSDSSFALLGCLPPPPPPPELHCSPLSNDNMVFQEPQSSLLAKTPANVGKVLTRRVEAKKRLMKDPNDIEARNMLDEADDQMNAWAASKNVAGQFTGSTGVHILTAEQLGPQDPRYSAWAKKDLFKSANRVTDGVGHKLLQKLGWSPGEGLGKDRDGPLEPISVDVKADRKGLVSTEDILAAKRTHGCMKPEGGKHPVSLLMELCCKKHWPPPHFTCQESGPSNNRRFMWKVIVNGVEYEPLTSSNNKKIGKAQVCEVVLQSLGLKQSDSTSV